MKTPEDEAFDEIDSRQRSKNAERAFDEWNHSHRPEQFFLERKAFLAGWEAAMKEKTS